jgi:hypothetical protein
MIAVSQATDGLFCDTPPLIVSNGQVWDGMFCLDGAVVEPPVTGGGGTTSAPGTHFNQAPPKYRDPRDLLNLEQALQEDEEMLLMIKAFVETIQ